MNAITPTTVTIAALASVALAVAPAHAASTTLGSPDDVTITGAYAYLHSTTFMTSKGPRDGHEVIVVARTKGPMPRRFDGMPRFDLSIPNALSLSSGPLRTGRRGRNCVYRPYQVVKGRLRAEHGKTAPKAKLGTKYRVTVSAKDASGTEHSSTRTVTLRKLRKGDAAGRPLHC